MNFLEIFYYRPSARRKNVYNKEINEQEKIIAMKRFSNNSPGNDGLTKEFYETF